MRKRTQGKVAGKTRLMAVGDRVVVVGKKRHFAQVGTVTAFKSKLNTTVVADELDEYKDRGLWFMPEELQPLEIAMAAAKRAIEKGLKGLSPEARAAKIKELEKDANS